MTLWFILALMTAAAVFAVLWPLSRPVPVAGGSEVAVYRDQLAEIERDRAAGRIGAAEAEAARTEVSRRLLAAADAERDPAERPTTSARARRIAAVAALVLVPLGGLSLYLALGSPALPGQPLAARLGQAPGQRSIETLVAQVETHLEKNPNDGRGWEVLAPVYLRAGRFNDAVKARSEGLRLNGETAERQADLGEALVAAAQGVVTADAAKAFARAHELDPTLPKARFFLGLAAEQDGRPADAAKRWRELVAEAPVGAPWAAFVREALARVDPAAAASAPASTAAPGPSTADVAAAAALSPEQRHEMVRGMVARLAARLRDNGGDLDGWVRLMRAYMVLGERDKARSALADARKALAGDVAKLRHIDDTAKGLGLDG
jgi:cytochrome c-type biogenesis protein CcmH